MALPDEAGLPADPSDLIEVLRRAATAIGPFLPKSGLSLAIGEVLPVWVIMLSDLQSRGGLAKAEDQHLWHLQLRPTPGEPSVAFARIKDLARTAEVQAVYLSPLAGAIDDAIDLADRRYPDAGWRARLLELPEIHLALLWLVRPNQSRLIFLDDSLPGGGKWEKLEDLADEEFQSRLQSVEPILGIAPQEEDDDGDEEEDGNLG